MNEINFSCELIFIIVFILMMCISILFISYFLGGKSYGRNKNTNFESGIVSTGNTQIQLSIKFYLTAVFFVIFDIESLYLYSWSLCIREIGWLGFLEGIIFIFMLVVSLVYLIRSDLLNWSSK